MFWSKFLRNYKHQFISLKRGEMPVNYGPASSICNLLDRFILSNRRLSPLEKAALNAVRELLDFSLSRLWDQQVSTINKIQRLPGGVEVNFYRMQGRKVNFDPEIAFPIKARELPIATVILQGRQRTNRLTATIWSVDGYIFSIEYDGCCKYFEEALGMDPTESLQTRCVLSANFAN